MVPSARIFAVWHLLLSPFSITRGFSIHHHGSSESRLFAQVPNGGSFSNDDDAPDRDEYLKELSEKYLGNTKPNFPTITDRPSKSDLYDDDELRKLLQVHQVVSPQTQPETTGEARSDIPSLHEMVLEAVGQIEAEQASTTDNVDDNFDTTNAFGKYPWLTDEIMRRAGGITAIASDVDGTLVSSTQTVHPRTAKAIKQAVQAAYSPTGKLQWFFPATGKTKTGALNSLGPELAALISQCPGVYVQGLYCVVGDKVIFEKKLTVDAISACERLVKEADMSIIAHDGDQLYTTNVDDLVKELCNKYGEPMASHVPSIAGHPNGVHKILVCSHDLQKLASVRPKLEALAKETGSCVTQAVPTMLELLPDGCSKALGVQKLCEVLGIDPKTQLLAIGDAENDVGMLEMASIGVAVGNAGDLAKNAADVVVSETNDEGGAGVAIEVLGIV